VSSGLDFHGVSRRFGEKTALDGLDLLCSPALATALVGPNGAGKSTALALAAGLLAPTAGTIHVDGRLLRPRQGPAGAGYLPQASAFHPLLRVGEILDFAAAVRRAGPAEKGRALAVSGLGPALGRPVGELSGGWVRRVGLLAALVGSPRLLLLDEPFVGLDPETLGRLLAHLTEAVADGVTVVVASHDFEVLDLLSPRVAVLDEGRLRHLVAPGGGSSRELYRQGVGAPALGGAP